VVQRNLARLSRSIGALLDFSRMDLGHISLSLQPFQLAGLLEQVATTVRSELDRKRLRFVVDLEPDLPPVIADREKLSAVVENLVINAIKFTGDRGRITVSARRVAASERPEAEISVEDTGIGIPQDQLGRIFQRFHQVDSSSTRRFGGVGLGLAIVKSILEAHGKPVRVAGHAWTERVIRMDSDGTPWRPFVHILDISRAVDSVLSAPREVVHGEVFNVGSNNQNYQIRSIAEIISDALPGCSLSIGDSRGDSRNYRVSFDRIHERLPGFECRYDVQRGARQLLDVFRAVDMTTETFEFRGHTRIRQIQHLLATRQIDDHFYWIDPPGRDILAAAEASAPVTRV